jgi:DNA/RNA endonuclease YhcR with UshA esterase domain
MKLTRLFAVAAFCVVMVSPAHAQTKRITAAEAKDHVGERVTVCGKLASTRYASKSKGQPTFLNLDQPYLQKIFTVVIWGNDRSKFGEPESKYQDQNICVTGKITSFHGEPEIAANQPDQIEIQNK